MQTRKPSKRIHFLVVQKRVKIAGWVLTFLVVAGTCELLAFVTLSFLLPGAKAGFLLYTPPSKPTKEEYEKYLRIRDPLLGWPTATSLRDGKIDKTGSRPTPYYLDSGRECVSLYGDSYVYGNEVTNEEAWGNLLSGMLKCRVANYGYSAYGSGQALLRFINMKDESAPITIFGIFMTNFKRNVNQYRYLIDGVDSNRFLFKPRFVLLSSGNLKHIPLPEIPYEQFSEFVWKPEKFLRHEYFIPGSTYGPIPLQFPYLMKFLAVLSRPEVKNWVLGRPDWNDFVNPGHSSGSMELTVAITKRFMAECQNRKKECLVVIFPSRNGYDSFRRTRKFAIQSFLDSLDKESIPYIHFTPLLEESLQERSICEILARPEDCAGHFGPEGNLFIARFVYLYLLQHFSEVILQH